MLTEGGEEVRDVEDKGKGNKRTGEIKERKGKTGGMMNESFSL